MSQFRIQVRPPKFPFQVDHQSGILSLGSCFAQNIGKRLAVLKFSICQNPFGILYNPISILNGLKYLDNNYQFTETDLFQYNDLWHSFQHHSQFSGLDKNEVLEVIQAEMQHATQAFQKCNRLFLTFGSAYVYEHLGSQQIVANCHKVPAKQFQKRRLEVSAIVDAYTPFLKQWKAAKPDLEVTLTVSPIRHIKDGIIENQRSKATLLLAIDKLCEALDFVHYFPAYELLMDDLRDYRFYAEDMLHPSKIAVDYVWQVFESSFLSETTLALNKQLHKLQQGLNHRPFQAASEAHQRFLGKLLKQIQQLERQYPYLSFEQEKGMVKTQLLRN